jgi:hypothetical protein
LLICIKQSEILDLNAMDAFAFLLLILIASKGKALTYEMGTQDNQNEQG